MAKLEKQNRVVIEGVDPEIDSGRFPVKRIIGDEMAVEADIFADGHDMLSARLLYRKAGAPGWREVSMELLVNDRWRGSFTLTELGRYQYTVIAWVDRFLSWRQSLEKKSAAGQDVAVELLVGAEIIGAAAERAQPADAAAMREVADALRGSEKTQPAKIRLALSKRVADRLARYPENDMAARYPRELEVVVDRERARYGAWYEVFPRSCSPEAGKHGAFRDVEKFLPYISGMGFDVIYFPPVHPIGNTARKGRNNAAVCEAGDPGTPWAIGSSDGGHKSLHPQLGTLDDFRHLLAAARKSGLEIALDIAFQCSPDHPCVKEHPEWFRWRPDGTVQYAENPPKKYQDIYPLDFETAHWRELWEELKGVVLFWIEQGVRIFRVDNPHTKPFAFWEYLITEIKRDYPDAIFFAEAFTRPKVMYRLAKLGFSQSYTYFTWRNLKWELEQYFTELTQTGVREYFRPNLWPNTPDILSDYLRDGGRPAFMVRLALAATLGASYGIYGPAFELCQNQRKDKASEEYLNSEKYEIKHWDIGRADSIKDLVAIINSIRCQNPALHSDLSLRFHDTENDQLICYSKRTDDFSNVILIVVNLNYEYTQSGWVELSLDELGLDTGEMYEVRDFLTGAVYQWQGARNYVELDPLKIPAHIFRISRKISMKRE